MILPAGTVARSHNRGQTFLANSVNVGCSELAKKVFPTGLFRVRGNFDTPLNSVVDGPILKSYEVVIAITGGFDLVYNNASQVGNYLLKIWLNFLTNLGTNEMSGKSNVYFH